VPNGMEIVGSDTVAVSMQGGIGCDEAIMLIVKGTYPCAVIVTCTLPSVNAVTLNDADFDPSFTTNSGGLGSVTMPFLLAANVNVVVTNGLCLSRTGIVAVSPIRIGGIGSRYNSRSDEVTMPVVKGTYPSAVIVNRVLPAVNAFTSNVVLFNPFNTTI